MNQLNIIAPSNLNDPITMAQQPSTLNSTSTNSSSNMSSPEIICPETSPLAIPASLELSPVENLTPSLSLPYPPTLPERLFSDQPLPVVNDLSRSFPYRPPLNGQTIRLKPLAKALSTLDKKGKQKVRFRPIDINEDEQDKAARLLEEHRKSRMPYVQLASQRLQTVLGEKNDWEFEFLDTPEFAKHQPQFRNSGSVNVPPASRFRGIHESLLKTALKTRASQKQDLNIDSTPNVQPQVVHFDPETGKGLRDWLFQSGNDNEMVKKSFGSISFHDFTPDIMTGKFSNTLLGHYTAETPGSQVECYEMKLPTETADPKTGGFGVTMETWIWFLISRPTVSITTEKAHPSHSHLNGATDRNHFQTPHLNHEPHDIQVPPNFPHPIPTSWVIFACPLANITQYPTIIEKPFPSPFPILEELPEPTHPPAKRSRKTGKLINKRQDYDFSHQGVPEFEFSNSTLEVFIKDPRKMDEFKKGNFLSVEGMVPFRGESGGECSGDGDGQWRQVRIDSSVKGNGIPRHKRRPQYKQNPKPEPSHTHGDSSSSFTPKSPSSYTLELEAWDHDLNSPTKNRSEAQINEDILNCRQRETEFPCPYHGSWWKGFYEGIYKDEARWRRVREAMAKGKSRVVVRWREWEGGDEGFEGGDEGSQQRLKRGGCWEAVRR